jgi:hypothetical protein
MTVCPNCGNQTGEGAVFCDQCGTKIPQPEMAAPEPVPVPGGGSVICPACGAGNVPGEAFCDYCGSPLEPPVPSVEQVQELEPVSSEAELEVETAPAEPVVEEVAPPVEEPSLAEAEAKPTCPACGAEVLPGEAFCGDCGASLAQPPIPPEPVAEVVVPEPVVPEPAAEPEVAPEPVAEVAAALACPACGTEIEVGDRFCNACGFALKEAPSPALVPPVPAPVVAGPRLLVVASGAEIPLPAGEEILIGREDPVSGLYPDVDLTPHGGEEGGVSRRHARLLVEGGNYFVEDLDSTNFTFVNKQKLTPKVRQQVRDGDEIRFGRVAMTFRT